LIGLDYIELLRAEIFKGESKSRAIKKAAC